jgi:hypothetical protein
MSSSTGSGNGLSGLAWFKARWGTVGVEVVLILGEDLAQVCSVDGAILRPR